MPQALYLDDLAVGRKFVTGSTTLTLEGCKAFAAEFDPQPFHLDEAGARASVFGRLAASGWYTASLSMRLLVEGELTIAGGLIGLGGEMTWPRPAYPGDTLHVETEVLAVRRSESKPIAASSRCAIRRSTSTARPCRSPSSRCWCRAGLRPRRAPQRASTTRHSSLTVSSS